jgi:putative inorganic carbon (HCO3(-)) transporter
MIPCSETLRRFRLAGLAVILVGTACSNSLIGIGTGIYAVGLALTVLPFFLPAFSGQPRLRLPAPPFIGLLLALTVSTLYSFAISGYPKESLQGIWKYVCAFLAFYAAAEAIGSPKERRWIVTGFVVCAVIAAVSGIGQDFCGRDFIRGRSPVLFTDAITRITGPFKHCNDFASFLVPGWLVTFAAFTVSVKRRKTAAAALSFVALALIGWAVGRTMSRAAMIGAAAGMIFLAFHLPYRRWIAGALAAGSAAAWFVPSTISTRLHSLFDLNVALRERIQLIEGTLKMVQDAPWFGLGLNTYSRLFPIYNPPDPAAPVLMYAHNSYLQMAAEAGMVGLVLYLAYVSRSLRAAFTVMRGESGASDRWIQPGLIAAVIGLLVNALFESLLQSTQLRTLFWCFLGLAVMPALRKSAR